MSELETYDARHLSKVIWHYRKTGMAWDDIQQAIHSDHGVELEVSQLHSLYRNYRQVLSEMYGPEDREMERGMEIERLNEMQHAWWDIAMAGSEKGATLVLNVMKQRHRLLGLDMPDASDPNVTNNVLVIGESKQAWIDALAAGRDSKRIMPGPPGDDSDDETHNDQET